MAVTLKKVAASAGVSVNTVSDIVNRGRSNLYDPKTIERVRQSAHDVGYRRRRSPIIGFATWTIGSNRFLANPPGYVFVVGLSQYLGAHGYHLALIELSEFATGDHSLLPSVLRDKFCEGFVLHEGVWGGLSGVHQRLKTPLVWWDTGLKEATGCVDRDELWTGRHLTERLLELGHRRIAYHWWKSGYRRYSENRARPSEAFRQVLTSAEGLHMSMHYSERDRYAGYLKAMKAAGLQPRPLVADTTDEMEGGLRELRPDALIIGGPRYDSISQAAFRLGKSIPQDLSLASTDVDSRILLGFEIRVGGMEYDRFAAGKIAGEMMMAMVSDDVRPPSVRLRDTFHMGQTIVSRV
jgi:DNA-binding LacI/PurR family transcriptional regulator